MVKILSQNVRGLQNIDKRKMVFHHLHSKAEVVCLQETHATDKDKQFWENEWGGSCFWSNHKSDSGGVGILIRKNSSIVVKHSVSDNNGRVVAIQYLEQDEQFVLVNVYGPNQDNPDFYIDVLKLVENLEGKRIIVGDFNTIINEQLDRTSSEQSYYKKASLQIINKITDENYLVDIWRDRNPEQRTYTWCRKMRGKLVGSRIDYMLIEHSIGSWTESIKIIPGYKSDHSAIIMEIIPYSIKRGPGVWRINNTILYEKEYLTTISHELDLINERGEALNPHEKWETIKIAVAFRTQEYCRERASNRKLIIAQLEEALIKLQQKGEEIKDHEIDMMNRTKQDLDDFITEKLNSIAFRAGCQWYNDAEKSSKYFLNLEKARAGAKGMNSILKDSTIVRNPKEIVKEQAKFYQKLYKKDEQVTFKYINSSGIKITPEQVEATEGEIQIQELENALKKSKRNKVCVGGMDYLWNFTS